MNKKIIGMLHLLPLPGSPNYFGNFNEVIDRAKQDLENLLEGGINTVNIENYGDVPFSNKPAKPITVSAFTKIVSHLESEFDFDFGVQVMRNDAISGLSIAEITGASFIRVNVLTGAVVAEEGIIEGDARSLMDLKKQLNSKVQVFADVLVKHAVPLGNQDLRLTAKATVERNLADGIILTGDITGEEASVEDLKLLKQELNKPILIGSGINKDNVNVFLEHCDGVIVGTSLKKDNPKGLNYCWDKVMHPEFKEKTVYAESRLFTAPLGEVIRHNWFKDQSNIKREVLLRLHDEKRSRLSAMDGYTSRRC